MTMIQWTETHIKEMAIVEKKKQMEILDLKNKNIKMRSSPDSCNKRVMWAGKKKKIHEVEDGSMGKWTELRRPRKHYQAYMCVKWVSHKERREWKGVNYLKK